MSDLPGPWQPGYWETAGETGEHGPPPAQLEHARVIPSRCSLWMKLVIYKQVMRPRVNNVTPYFRSMSVEDGWAYGRDAWLSMMQLMAETFAHPPNAETSWISDILPNERLRFRQSLSDCQLRAWEILRDWWDGSYQDADLASRARAFILTAPVADIDSLRHKESLYQQMLFALWDAEFNPSAWSTGTSRGLDSNRRLGYEHALAQKAGFLLLQELRPSSNCFGQDPCGMELPSSYDICPWLSKGHDDNKNPEQLPLYLWDTAEDRTRSVAELLDNEAPIDYTCISHTWGRWKKKPESRVEVQGVKWKIPENTLFEVTNLPTILRQSGCKTRFIWFDLVCLPQDISSPEYQSEVARQATIFHHASSCVAWINKVASWKNLRASLRWLCLYFLYAGTSSDLYDVRTLLQEAEAIESPIELVNVVDGEGAFEAWITSTWTLQESCLCPDILLCNKDWEPLEIVDGSPVSLHQLLTIWSVCREGNFDIQMDISEWPMPVQQLAHIQSMVSGLEVQISRLVILSLGATRECAMRRADAVMSAMGVTDWYETYLNEHQRPPPDEDMVLGAYPLRFIKEVASKIGSEFFSNFNPGVLAPEEEDPRGTLLPFGRPGTHLISGSGLGVNQSLYDDTFDHPSLQTWTINTDGSVHIREACVLGLGHLTTEGPVNALLNVARIRGGIDLFHCDLQEFLQKAPENVERIALVLNRIRDTTNGMLLQSKVARDGAVVGWINIGTWDTRDVADFPLSVDLDIIVL
ncbi:hypothetical protein PG993_003117 [Apiospora rasikravindrae]|uniref:Heterokaryon incompatibility domain-containing protein n=1 Tax=Apiospora rasikravindrae TaxID=990691 RepID=A0ABR1TYP0_9PEZI